MEARAYLAQEGRILVEFDPVTGKADRDRAYAMSRSVTAGRWQGKYGRAHYPLSVEKCNEMRQVWATSLRVHKDLSDWYRSAAVDRLEQVQRASAVTADLHVLPSDHASFYAWLKDDQRVGANWVKHAYRDAGLVADEVGVGKTFTVVGGLMERQVKGSILIVCPKLSVRRVWGAALKQWCPWPVYLCYGSRARREKVIAAFLEDPAETCVLVIVAEMLRIKAVRSRGRIKDMAGYEYEDLFDVDWDAVVIDESHKLLGALDITHGNLAAEGLRRLNYGPAPLRLAASATPWGRGGRIESFFGTLHWLWPDEFTSKWAWINKYFEVTEKEIYIKGGGGRKRAVTKVGGLLPGVTEEQLYKDLGPRVLRRTMEEVSPQHAGLKNWHVVPCEMEGRQEKLYEQFAIHGEVPVHGGVLSSLGTLSYYTRARQLANGVVAKQGDKVFFTGVSNKIEKLIFHLDTHGILDGSSPRKVVVASQFNEFLDVVAERLTAEGCEHLMMTGATSEAKRDRIMDSFQGKGGPQVFLLNGKAGGVSITLDAADELHELDEMYPPEANTQLFGRIFRRGRVHKVYYYLYRSVGTIDEKIGSKVEAGLAQQSIVMDGRRGLTDMRKLAQYTPPED